MGNKPLTIKKMLLKGSPILYSAIFFILFTIAYYCIPPFSLVYVIRILLGLTALIIIPGYYLSLAFFNRPSGLAERLGFSLIFGLALQVFNVVVLWAVLDILPIPLEESLYFMTFSAMVILTLFLRNRPVHGSVINRINSIDILLLVGFVSAISLRLWYQSFNNNYITPDGAYYSDIARNIVNSGDFVSKTVFVDPVRNIFEQHGLTMHPVVPFTLALFFIIGGVSYFSAKLAVLFAGSLIVFTVYFIANEVFNKHVGIIASFIIALYPLLTFYSSILFGDEMINNLFFLMAFYLFILSFKYVGNTKSYPILAGWFLFLSRGAWQINADIFLLLLPLLPVLIVERVNLKDSLFNALYCWLIFASIFLGPKPTYWVPLMSLALIMGLIGLKMKNSYARTNSLALLSYSLFLDLSILRLYRHTDLLSVTGTPLTDIISVATAQSSYDLFQRTDTWIEITKNLAGPLLTLSIASILIPHRLKNTSLMFAHPVVYSSIFILYYSIPYLYEERFFIPLILFFSILAASVIEALSSAARALPSIRLRIGKWSQKLRLDKVTSFGLIFLVVSSMFYLYYYGQYFDGLNKMRQIDPVGGLYMEPTIQWITENTSENAILMNSNPVFYSWFANRQCVIARELNLTQLYNVISSFHVDYFIVDPDTRIFLPEIYSFIMRDWRNPLPGFKPVFYQQYSSDLPIVIIYDVAKARDLKKSMINISSGESSYGWSVGTFYQAEKPTLKIDYSDYIESNGSIIAYSPRVPQNSDIYLKYDLPKPLNITGGVYLHLWIKTRGLTDKATVWQVEIGIIDSDKRWGVWQFGSWSDGKWLELYLPIGLYSSFSPEGPPKLSDIIQLTVRIANRGGDDRELKLWIDDVYVIVYTPSRG